MARGDRPLPLDQLEPYMRGAKFVDLRPAGAMPAPSKTARIVVAATA
jgi:hypothetical protein